MCDKPIEKARVELDNYFLKPQKEEYDNWKEKLESAVSEFQGKLKKQLSKKRGLKDKEFYVLGRVKPWDSIKVKLEETRIRYWSECKDLLAFKIVVLSLDNVVFVQSAINPMVLPGTRRGYQARHMQTNVSEMDVPEGIKRVGAELQILTEFQQTWDKLTHDDFYKTKIGVPTEGRNRAHRLAAIIDLLDEELVQIRNRIKKRRSEIFETFSSNNENWKLLEIDEYSLYKAAKEHLHEQFKKIRTFARNCGYRTSAWEEMVRFGMETDNFISLCADLNVDTFKDLERYLVKVETYESQLRELVSLTQKRKKDKQKQSYLFDRPLTIISIVMMLENPSIAIASFKKEIILDIQKLAHENIHNSKKEK
jgi:ppGpp synthetase/RelA/SpoT-type nucleotidyltranferase